VLTAYGPAIVLDLLGLFMGARFLLQPVSAAAGYGVPSQPSPYLTIKGLRGPPGQSML
jgi:hypothetical protein